MENSLLATNYFRWHGLCRGHIPCQQRYNTACLKRASIVVGVLSFLLGINFLGRGSVAACPSMFLNASQHAFTAVQLWTGVAPESVRRRRSPAPLFKQRPFVIRHWDPTTLDPGACLLLLMRYWPGRELIKLPSRLNMSVHSRETMCQQHCRG
jgi:hypothetical protein